MNGERKLDSQQPLALPHHQNWEETVISWAVQNPDAFFPLSNKMKDWHFQGTLNAKLWKKLLDVYTVNQRFPAPGEAQAIAQSITGLEAETQSHLIQILARIYSNDVSAVTGDTVSTWVADRELAELAINMTALVQGDAPGVDRSKELDKWIERLQSVQQLTSTKRLGSSFEPLDPKAISDPNKTVEGYYAGLPQSTGFWRIDGRLRDQGIRGHSTIIFGPTGGGKTELTLNIAMHCLRRGGRVVWITLDDDPGEITERVYSHMLGRPFRQNHISNPNWASKLLENALPKFPGHFWGEHILPSTHTPQDVIRELMKLQRHFYVKDKNDTFYDCSNPGQIDMVVIDTADQIRAHRHYQKEWYELEKSFEELSRISPQLGCPVILTAQAGQEGMGASQMTLRNISGSFGKNKAAKLILAVAQTYHQVHSKKTINFNDPKVQANMHHYNDKGVYAQLDSAAKWEPFWVCILKNTRADDSKFDHVRYVKLPFMAHHSTCRVIEDWEQEDELITNDKKTQREEKQAEGVIPGVEAPAQGDKRGNK